MQTLFSSVIIAEMKHIPICTILWQDAAYSDETTLPKELPSPQLTAGFIIEANDEFVFIATNVDYYAETREVSPVDGFIIPKKTIIEFKKIGNYND
jgi:hypothetical protein